MLGAVMIECDIFVTQDILTSSSPNNQLVWAPHVTLSILSSPLCRSWLMMSSDLGLHDVSDVQGEDIIMAVVRGTHDDERCSDKHHPLCTPASHWLSLQPALTQISWLCYVYGALLLAGETPALFWLAHSWQTGKHECRPASCCLG